MVAFLPKITGTNIYLWKAASLLEWMNKGWPNINFGKMLHVLIQYELLVSAISISLN